MSKQKQEVGLSFKISQAMSGRIAEECENESRAISDMAKVLIAEALMYREAKRSMRKIL